MVEQFHIILILMISVRKLIEHLQVSQQSEMMS
jgi:hypothetical protein